MVVPNSLLTREKCLYHQAELSRLTAEKMELPSIRIFKPLPGPNFTNQMRSQERAYEEVVERLGDLELDQMLAELREGSVEYNY